jgi:intracellular sulfur oxidation DsrE/DsrF family protein
MQPKKMSRRSVVTGCGAAVAAAAAALGVKPVAAQGMGGSFQPARHPEDAWMDSLPGKHRVFVDASTAQGAGEAILYANNLFEANKNGYGLADSDVAIIVCLRHFATAFAFTDAIWAKYGTPVGTLLGFMDPKTKQPPKTNLLFSAEYGMQLSNLGNTIPAVTKRGVQFAVCDMATHFMAAQLAGAGGNADAIYKELTANLIPSSHMVPAGVVAGNRAQEHGYTLQTTL